MGDNTYHNACEVKYIKRTIYRRIKLIRHENPCLGEHGPICANRKTEQIAPFSLVPLRKMKERSGSPIFATGQKPSCGG